MDEMYFPPLSNALDCCSINVFAELQFNYTLNLIISGLHEYLELSIYGSQINVVDFPPFYYNLGPLY